MAEIHEHKDLDEYGASVRTEIRSPAELSEDDTKNEEQTDDYLGLKQTNGESWNFEDTSKQQKTQKETLTIPTDDYNLSTKSPPLYKHYNANLMPTDNVVNVDEDNFFQKEVLGVSNRDVKKLINQLAEETSKRHSKRKLKDSLSSQDSENSDDNEYQPEQLLGIPKPSLKHSLKGSLLVSTKKERVTINVGGIKHVTYRNTLRNVPDTRLSWIADSASANTSEFDAETGEFFFDRHPTVFAHVLNYYRTGKLHVPYDVCGPMFEEELQFWGIDDSQVESCCWISYRQHREAQETLKEFEGIELDYDAEEDSEPDLTRYGFRIDPAANETEKQRFYEKWQPRIWTFFEDPYSSKQAKILAYVSLILILLSVMIFCLETMNSFQTNHIQKLIILILEGICVAYFTIELTLRFIFCPNKLCFLKNIMNWIDFIAIVPFFVDIILKKGFNQHNNIAFLQIVRVIRVFRIIKLSKHSMGLQILGHTLKASFRELFLLIFFLMIGIVIFSSLIYYCEKDVTNTKFHSIPRTFWWAVITMTTVGYGDMVPDTLAGKIIGSICAICGVLMIALPVPVIVNNFNLYYSHAQARSKLPKKRRKVLCGADNILKEAALASVDQNYEKDTQMTDIDDSDSEKSEEEDSIVRDKEDVENNINNDNRNKNNNRQFSVMITDEDDKHELDEEDLEKRRLKKFGRRESNRFHYGMNPKIHNGDTKGKRLTTTGGASHYNAMHKRKSLLPGIPALPEIEQ